MFKVRKGTFETNSSSTHVFCLLSKDEVEKFKNGELFLDFDRKQICSSTNLFVVDKQHYMKQYEESGLAGFPTYYDFDEYLEAQAVTFKRLKEQNKNFNWDGEEVMFNGYVWF